MSDFYVNSDFAFKNYYNEDLKEWRGAPFRPLYNPEESVGRILFEVMRRQPDHICQISDSEGTKLTNAEALQLAIQVAKYFEAKGLKQYDIVGVAGRNTTYLMVVALACFFSGITLHAVCPTADLKTIKLLFEITKPKIIFFDGQDYERIKCATKDFDTMLITQKQHMPEVQSVLELLNTTKDEHEFYPVELIHGAKQTLAILSSSGSTGLPKAVTISNNHRWFDFMGYLTANDIMYTISTLDWLSGLLNLIGSLGNGVTRVISDRPFTVDYFLEIVQKYKITFVIMAPSLMPMLLAHPTLKPKQLSSFRYLIYGGSKSTVKTQLRMKKYLPNARMCFAYGLTEFGRIATSNFDIEDKPNSVGRVLPGYRFKITDEQGNSLGPGEIGEICCDHGDTWGGYCGNAESTQLLRDADGWFRTGDLGYFDADGYLFVVDRKKDLLKYCNIQYCPNEIEEVIMEIPDVLDGCVFGVWNEYEGDAAAAAVVTMDGSSLTADSIVKYVEKHTEVKYKHLNAGALILEELPKLPNGKINRMAAKDIFIRHREREM